MIFFILGLLIGIVIGAIGLCAFFASGILP